VFDIVENLSKFLLEIITLMSSMNKMGSDQVFLVGSRLFIYNMKCKGPKINPWGTPGYVLLFPILRKIPQMILFFCFLFVR
jgi:hypothetical protein